MNRPIRLGSHSASDLLPWRIVFFAEANVAHAGTTASTGGQLRIELQNATGQALPGFALSDCQPLTGDSAIQVVQWNGGSLSKIQNKPVLLRIELKQADFYSIKF